MQRSAAVGIPLLAGATGGMVATGEAQQVKAPSDGASGFPGVITRQTQPLNVEFPFPTLGSFLTPNEQFYIRTHFEVPQLTAREWKLRVEGHVKRPFELELDELRKMPAETRPVLLECSGNGRVFLEPPQVSIRWEQGGVSNAEWTGVALSALLDRAEVKDGAVEVILEGYDKGKFDDPLPKTPGEIHYSRSLPLAKAREADVFLAYQMNGNDLPADHGFPVRAIVAGWYGMASVKWLRRIIVTDQPFHGYFQTFAYAIWERRHEGLPTLTPVTEILVKSQIARPVRHEVVTAGATYRVFGAAWSGADEIQRVEISTDEGSSWQPANLDQKSVPHAWRFFEFEWSVPNRPGKYVLMSKATNSRGASQPVQRDEDRRDAVVTHVQPHEVYVRSG